MDYPFENLNPEKFQEFAQALLNKEFPDLQCFPVAQSDGGRDIINYEFRSLSNKFTVYQVKYVRRPDAEKDTHKWLLEIIEGEAPKVKKLIKKGAKKFFLITNVRGTAHPDVGSIDKMNQLLEEKLGIPSRCWWRDDLNRKLDDAWNLKWTYPELMTGPDLIRSIIESGLSEHQERRAGAIRAFVTEQFASDQVVKFKQVDLQNRLLNLFIDVPALPLSDREENSTKHSNIYNIIARTLINDELGRYKNEDQHFYYNHERPLSIGTASLLLHPLVQSEIPWIVLEGAPGQGKSTITQYLCQVHRMRLFGADETRKLLAEDYKDSEGLHIIPEHHKTSHVALPFRIDLRDLASWLSGINPFSTEYESNEILGSHKSLEEFLSFLVNNFSGGFEFSVTDLVAVFKRSPVLLAFDGLDEVADMEKRRNIVNAILSGVKRLKSNALSLQVIVTSRPAAFANSPGLPESDFIRYCLDSLSRPLIDEYSNKWMTAKKLDQRECSEIKKILRDKLDQPHIRDLARNPMQLTILLSLIYNRGSSLPDKRTALYSSYVDLFFSREAEKTPVVKKHRDLLLDIHKYIAWVLHSEAEQLGKAGSITQEELQKVVYTYLDQEGHEVNLAHELVTGALERIVALVSRVEGTYEFEVQPLREYFAARYLYETAQHSSPGKEILGTKPDRFDAIARNFYWLNVARFYAGCYDKGELPSLIDRLDDLINSEGYNLISHPRLLAATLLSDWVFSQHPKSVKTVMNLILDGMGLRYVLPSSSRRIGSGEPMILPIECGRDELIKHCFNLLNNQPPLDFALDVINLISANTTSPKDNLDLWLDNVLKQHKEMRTKWLEYGLYLGILSQPLILSLDQLINIYSDLPQDKCRISLLYKARRFDYLESDEEIFNVSLQLILNKSFDHNRQKNKKLFILELFNEAVNSFRYAIALRDPRPIPLNQLLSRFFLENDFSIDENTSVQKTDYDNTKKCLRVIDFVNESIKVDAIIWATDLTPWSNLVEMVRQCWGDVWICFHLANIASGIKSSSETYTGYSELLDHTADLCKRVRYARLRAGQYSWWLNQITKANTDLDIAFSLLILVTWGSPKTLVKAVDKIDELIQRLSEPLWESLYNSVEEAIMLSPSSRHDLDLNKNTYACTINPKSAALISLRAKLKTRKLLYVKHLKEYDGMDRPTLKLCRNMSLEFLANDFSIWEEVRSVIQRSYSKNVLFESYYINREITSNTIPKEIALEIASNPSSYPSCLIAIAEMKLKEEVASKVQSVGEIADRDNWFDHL
ncbi:hypothetical protein KFZ76_07065 [Methylovulum psychrotolerans]|uniref:NACHT domain-containing protein n=1 Tax=Methylovulum psychrotolerans TaxID=1704499 RepID=UPI001BFF472F|nr:hypothetical protein [Methylovulum psychrotolerans]MBT9097471.1 hypothetical protein [Methylovulum psychrotolerans]